MKMDQLTMDIFYPGYSVTIKLTSNSIWCWLPQAVHGTSKLDTELENWYTAVLTLSEKTATAIENRLKKNNWIFYNKI